ncbi:hypothetical protein KA005_02480 [bacterium]|nr:hypothetical protein [bacterium]
MSFSIGEVLKDMAIAMKDSVREDVGDISEYAKQILENEKESLEELGSARLSGEIDDEVFDREIKREKTVVETELLTIQIMTKVQAQKAVNAAIDVFVQAIKVAL